MSNEIQVYLVHKPLATFFGGYNDDWLIPVVKLSEHELEVKKLKTEIGLLRKQRAGLHAFASAVTEVKSEEKLDAEIIAAVSKLGKG